MISMDGVSRVKGCLPIKYRCKCGISSINVRAVDQAESVDSRVTDGRRSTSAGRDGTGTGCILL
eukprot:709933-Ditylum_brightwellii.AAC.1